jgi:hypothetical protein
MFMVTIIPFLVLIVGGLMWALCKDSPKLQDAGRGLFFIGAFVLTWHYAGETVRLGSSR